MLVAVPTRFPFLDAGGPIAFAHRGAAPDGLENTLAAVDRVVALGFGYLETDVRATRDGVAVLLHDARLDRTTDRTGAVAALPWAEVAGPGSAAGSRCRGWTSCSARTRTCGSTSTSRRRPRSARWSTAVRRAGAVDRVCIGSFHDRLIPLVRARLGARLCTSLGPRGGAGAAAGHAAADRRPAAPRCRPGCGRIRVIDARFMAAAHRRGLAVHAWTVNDPAEMNRLLDLGVDGIMSDDAPALRDVLVARQAWTP